MKKKNQNKAKQVITLTPSTQLCMYMYLIGIPDHLCGMSINVRKLILVYTDNKGADQPDHPLVIRLLESKIAKLANYISVR